MIHDDSLILEHGERHVLTSAFWVARRIEMGNQWESDHTDYLKVFLMMLYGYLFQSLEKWSTLTLTFLTSFSNWLENQPPIREYILNGEYWTICRNYPVCVARTFRCLEIQEKPAIYRVKPLYRRVKCLFGFVRGIFIHKILRFNLFPETRSSKTHVKMSMFCPCCFANVLRRLCYETLKKGLTMNYALQKPKTNKTPENQGVDT